MALCFRAMSSSCAATAYANSPSSLSLPARSWARFSFAEASCLKSLSLDAITSRCSFSCCTRPSFTASRFAMPACLQVTSSRNSFTCRSNRSCVDIVSPNASRCPAISSACSCTLRSSSAMRPSLPAMWLRCSSICCTKCSLSDERVAICLSCTSTFCSRLCLTVVRLEMVLVRLSIVSHCASPCRSSCVFTEVMLVISSAFRSTSSNSCFTWWSSSSLVEVRSAISVAFDAISCCCSCTVCARFSFRAFRCEAPRSRVSSLSLWAFNSWTRCSFCRVSCATSAFRA
mmetsp:Transcript_129755/g.224266  ORF Transcript_129755/g.224266 Transcript_129755/m.224266 type:complete len:287 (-) Transcript_129755:3882-4742(-)